MNSVTNRDYFEIVSTFITMTQPKYRCSDCKLKYKAKFKQQQEFMACNYVAKTPRHGYTPEFHNKSNPKIIYNKCIGNYYNGFWSSIINSSKQYDNGIMPFSGGIMDQPAKFVEVMNLVHNLISENELENQRKEKLSRKR